MTKFKKVEKILATQLYNLVTDVNHNEKSKLFNEDRNINGIEYEISSLFQDFKTQLFAIIWDGSKEQETFKAIEGALKEITCAEENKIHIVDNPYATPPTLPSGLVEGLRLLWEKNKHTIIQIINSYGINEDLSVQYYQEYYHEGWHYEASFTKKGIRLNFHDRDNNLRHSCLVNESGNMAITD